MRGDFMDQGNKKKYTAYVAALIAGLLLGFFGVFLSVFSDGPRYERLITILIILVIYGVIGIVIGVWKPEKTFIYLPFISLPGILILLVYSFGGEFKPIYIPYMLLVLLFPYFGLKTGKSFKHKK